MRTTWASLAALTIIYGITGCNGQDPGAAAEAAADSGVPAGNAAQVVIEVPGMT